MLSHQIVGYYQNYARVRQTFRLMATTVLVICCVAFMIFQLFANFIVSSFGSGDALYVSFAVRLLRIYMFFTFLNGLQPIIANFFTSIGKATKGDSRSNNPSDVVFTACNHCPADILWD